MAALKSLGYWFKDVSSGAWRACAHLPGKFFLLKRKYYVTFKEGEYTAGAGGETIVPIHGPGATGTTSRLRRSASVEHNPDSLAEKPPTGSRQPAFVHDDKFFNEKITLPRLAVNEREHITAEDYDNEDRGSLDSKFFGK